MKDFDWMIGTAMLMASAYFAIVLWLIYETWR